MSGVSKEDAGIANYTTKRDFRRLLDREIRSEGYDKFRPNPIADVTAQSTPPNVDGPITLTAEAFLPNGNRTAVVGTKTTIWKYIGLSNGSYNIDGYNTDGYFDTGQGQWSVIAKGLSPNGRRWESVQVGGFLVLNNGVDLPLSYNLNDPSAYPIYELRENSIASVGTISVINDILMCHDVRQINDDALTTLMSPIRGSVQGFVSGVQPSSPTTGTVNSGVAGVAGSVLTASDDTFNGGNGFTGLVGRVITMANGLSGTVLSVASSTVCTLDNAANLSEPSQPFTISRDHASATAYYDNALQPDIATLFPDDSFALNPNCVVGLHLFWDNGTISQITGIETDAVTGLKYFLLASNQPIPFGIVSLQNPSSYALYDNQANISSFHGRNIWSLPDDPRRFGSIIPCFAKKGASSFRLKYPVKSLSQYFGDGGSIEILGAGLNENNLTSVINYVYPGITSFVSIADRMLSDKAEVRSSGQFSTVVTPESSSIVSLTAFKSLGSQYITVPIDFFKTTDVVTTEGSSILTSNSGATFTILGFSSPTQLIAAEGTAISNETFSLVITRTPTSTTLQFGLGSLVGTTSKAIFDQSQIGGTLTTTGGGVFTIASVLSDTTAVLTHVSGESTINGETFTIVVTRPSGQYVKTIPAVITTQDLTCSKQVGIDVIESNDDFFEVTDAGAKLTTQGGLVFTISEYISPTEVSVLEDGQFSDQKFTVSAAPTSCQRADTVGSITGQFQDLDDDGGGILKALLIRGYLAIYKSTPNIYLAQYTGSPSQPFVFNRIRCAQGTQLAYPHTLCNVNDLYHVYASETEFYQIDILRQVPTLFEPLHTCSNLFFDQADQGLITGANLVPANAVYDGSGNYTLTTAVGYDQQFQITHEDGSVEVVTPLPRLILPELVSQTPPATSPITITGTANTSVGASIQAVVEQSGSDRVFTAVNSVTKEFFFCFPSQTDDKCLRFDYVYNTVSSSSLNIIAAASIRRPTGQSSSSNNEDWFVMGLGGGSVYRYGLMSGQSRSSGSITVTVTGGVATASAPFFQSTDVWKSIKTSDGRTFAVTNFTSSRQVSVIGTGATNVTFSIIPSLYHRDGVAYDSILKPGLDAFGSAETEKILYEYVLILSSQSPSSVVNVGFFGSVNPTPLETPVQSATLSNPSAQNLIQPTLMGNYVADQITVSGMNNPLELVMRSFRVVPVDSHNIGRANAN